MRLVHSTVSVLALTFSVMSFAAKVECPMKLALGEIEALVSTNFQEMLGSSGVIRFATSNQGSDSNGVTYLSGSDRTRVDRQELSQKSLAQIRTGVQTVEKAKEGASWAAHTWRNANADLKRKSPSASASLSLKVRIL